MRRPVARDRRGQGLGFRLIHPHVAAWRSFGMMDDVVHLVALRSEDTAVIQRDFPFGLIVELAGRLGQYLPGVQRSPPHHAG